MSASDVRAIVCGYPQRLWGKLPLVMLVAHVDDSIADNRHLYWAAYVLSAEEWIEFSNRWDAALAEAPAIEYFKMKEAHGRHGCFRGWTKLERNKKVFKLAQVVREFAPHGLHASIDIKAHKEKIDPVSPYPSKSPYFLLTLAVIYGLAKMNERLLLAQPCKIVFDNSDGLLGRLEPVYDLMTAGDESWREFIGPSPTFADDKEVLPLQAADLLAWHIRRHERGGPAPDYDGILDLLMLDGAHYSTHIDEAIIDKLAEGFKVIPQFDDWDKRENWNEAVRLASEVFGQAHADVANPLRDQKDVEGFFPSLLRRLRDLVRPRR